MCAVITVGWIWEITSWETQNYETRLRSTLLEERRAAEAPRGERKVLDGKEVDSTTHPILGSSKSAAQKHVTISAHDKKLEMDQVTNVSVHPRELEKHERPKPKVAAEK